MSYSILPTLKFEKEIKQLIKKLPSLKKEYAELINQLIGNPNTGTSVGNSCYKIRLSASKGKGKRGGVRVIIYNSFREHHHLSTYYHDKSEQEAVRDVDIDGLRN